jgi:soluble lytic murein transglycosylase-like protein
MDALTLASAAIEAARRTGIDPEFFCATILQESAFSPWALSSAAAVGIAQFTLDTAAAYDVNPFDWRDALRGSSFLLASYVETYHHASEDEYVLALAAYNAGPGAVAHYGGVPPYRETRGYIGDIIDRWARIVRWERP